jgi:hypothetical protein
MLVVQRFFIVSAVVVTLVGCAANAGGSSPPATQKLIRGTPSNEQIDKPTPSLAGLVLRRNLVSSMDPETAQRDADECRSWKYDSSSLKEHLLSMKQISKSDWGRRCYQYACSAVGEAELKGRVYRVEVNAGGWIALDVPGEASIFLASPKQMPGFLAACDCCE